MRPFVFPAEVFNTWGGDWHVGQRRESLFRYAGLDQTVGPVLWQHFPEHTALHDSAGQPHDLPGPVFPHSTIRHGPRNRQDSEQLGLWRGPESDDSAAFDPT